MRLGKDETADELARLNVFSTHKVDALVDPYLVGFGRQTGSGRIALADAYKERAASSVLSNLIYRRILRNDDVATGAAP
jgi:hypothetical protein